MPSLPSMRFQGNCDSLSGHIFDCSDYKQADKYVTSLKRVSEHVGAEFKFGGDIQLSIVNEHLFTVPLPVAPTIVGPANPTSAEHLANMIFKGEIDQYIKRKAILIDNVQKAYILVIGQYTDLLQSKMKQQANWVQTSTDQDVIALLVIIKAITYKFEDQKFFASGSTTSQT